MFEMKMPKLGASMTEGTIVRWFVEEGAFVQKGAPIVEIQSDKIVLEVEAEADGPLQKQLYAEGETVAVFETLAFIGEGQLPQQLEEPEPTIKQLPLEHNSPIHRQIRRSPAARKLANQLQIDLSQIQGTGPRGRILKIDVENILKQHVMEETAIASVVTQQSYSEQTLSPVRKIIADRMTQSTQTTPHVTLHVEVDATKLLKLKEKIERDITALISQKLSVNDLVLKATIVALKRHPYMMDQLHGDIVRSYRDIHLGMAVDTPTGLVVPVVKDAQHLSLSELVQQTKEIVQQIKTGQLDLALLEGGTFTVSNLGNLEVQSFTPIINPPQSSILGVGTIIEKPRYKKGILKKRAMMQLSLSFDHRVFDGGPVARFLSTLKTIIENPIKLLL